MMHNIIFLRKSIKSDRISIKIIRISKILSFSKKIIFIFFYIFVQEIKRKMKYLNNKKFKKV